MLAPPPGGYDVEDGNLSFKNPARNSPNGLVKDNSPEQVPLLAEEAIPAHSSATKKEKVRT